MLHILKIANCSKLLTKYSVIQHARGITLSNVRTRSIEKLLPRKDEFQVRHIGPQEQEQLEMLKTIGYKVLFYNYLKLKYVL